MLLCSVACACSTPEAVDESAGVGDVATLDAGVQLGDASGQTQPTTDETSPLGDAAGSDADAHGGDSAVPILGPPYPIVLAHGFMGFNDFAGLGFVGYFYKIPEVLAAGGEKHIYTPAVDPFNDSTTRGKQLLAAIEKVLAKTGFQKVNIIGHSQGGLDARVVAHLRPDLVASVTTYAAPNRGTAISDMALKFMPTDNLQKLLDALAKAIGAPLYDKVGDNSSLIAAIKQFSEPGIKAFNATYTDRPGVAYFSVAGRTDLHSGGAACAADVKLPFIEKFKLIVDTVDPLFAFQEALLDGGIGAPYPNDGMVTVQSARWGTFIGCVPADHVDEVGHLLGDLPGFGNSWNYLQFFKDYIAWLRTQGL